MCVGILPACMSVRYMYAVPSEARRGHQIPLEPYRCGDQIRVLWEIRVFLATKPHSVPAHLIF